MLLNHNNPLPPVYKDQFNGWLRDPVTEHLLQDIKNMFLDSVIDPLPQSTMDALQIEAIKREGRREFIDLLLDWKPLGCDIDGE